jgi:hypothetical protein
MNHDIHHSHTTASTSQKELFKLSFNATLHCLLGCGIGEISGMIIAAALGWNNLHTILLSVTLGFVAGMLLGIVPLLRFGFSPIKALKTVFIGEGLSIAVMETVEVLTVLAIPGLMETHMADFMFWLGMIAALTAGFIAAFPVNYYFIKRGVRHYH